MSKKEKNERLDRVRDHLKAQAAIDRREFFANGGELVRWRGLHTISTDKCKRDNKRACRGRERE